MRMDMAGVDAAFGQDVDPDILKPQLFVPQIKRAWEESCREIDQKRLKTYPFLANRGGCIERYILVYSGHHLNQSL